MIFYRCLGRLPLALLYPVAWLTYIFIYYVSGYRKAVARENLTNAFPERSETEITVLLKKFYRGLCQTALEITRARYMSREAFLRRIEVLNPDLLADCSEGMTRTVIILTIHQGNWEWMLHGVSANLGVSLDPVYKPLHSPTADRFMREVRARFGARPIPMKAAPRDILGNRKQLQDEQGKAMTPAFDHAEILGLVVKRLRGKLSYAPLGFELLPDMTRPLE